MKIIRITQKQEADVSDEMKEAAKAWQQQNEEYDKKTKLLIPKLQEVYIRFGDIPEDEKSASWDRNVILHKYNGVSVFRGWHDLNTGWYVVATTGTEESHTDPYTLAYRPIYLVTGNEVGTGGDEEPLLRNVSIIKKLNPHQIIMPGSQGVNILDEEVNVVAEW